MRPYITRYNCLFRINGEIVKEFGIAKKGQFEFVSADDPLALIRIKAGEVFWALEPEASELMRFLLANGVIQVSIRE